MCSPLMSIPHQGIPPLPLYPSPRRQSARQISEAQTSRKTKNSKMQTQYRESSAQTSPWQPDYVVMDSGNPEILKLDFLKWGV